MWIGLAETQNSNRHHLRDDDSPNPNLAFYTNAGSTFASAESRPKTSRRLELEHISKLGLF